MSFSYDFEHAFPSFDFNAGNQNYYDWLNPKGDAFANKPAIGKPSSSSTATTSQLGGGTASVSTTDAGLFSPAANYFGRAVVIVLGFIFVGAGLRVFGAR
jgi:hypothetical protein